MTKTTPRPWIINGKTSAGWRIDPMIPTRTGIGFTMNPIAIVLNREDAELIVKTLNDAAAKEKEEQGGE